MFKLVAMPNILLKPKPTRFLLTLGGKLCVNISYLIMNRSFGKMIMTYDS